MPASTTTRVDGQRVGGPIHSLLGRWVTPVGQFTAHPRPRRHATAADAAANPPWTRRPAGGRDPACRPLALAAARAQPAGPRAPPAGTNASARSSSDGAHTSAPPSRRPHRSRHPARLAPGDPSRWTTDWTCSKNRSRHQQQVTVRNSPRRMWITRLACRDCGNPRGSYPSMRRQAFMCQLHDTGGHHRRSAESAYPSHGRRAFG
jgi:hypothetical protein